MEGDLENSGSVINQVDAVEQQLLFCLERYWGYKSFKHGQLEVCRNILVEKRDCFVSMATGSGKSLMFQLPAVTMREFGTPCISLVISPLLSLIEDQISALLSMGIPACSLATPEMERMVMDGVPVVVYTTPEKLQMWKHNLNVLHHKTPIISVAIDESHCVSEWGHDFRQEYRLLSVIREVLGPSVPIIALTASATPTVVDDIIYQLQLTNNVLKISSGLNRPNLKYIVKNKSSVEDVVEIVATYRQKQLRQEAQSQHVTIAQLDADAIPYPTTLVYVNSKKLCEDVAHYLVQSSLLSGIQVAYYHADMSLEERYCVHRGFLDNEIQVIVSTTAFGMGINKANVRLVIHYGLALSVEGYYQQTGRAGRDQQLSYCYLLWSLNDINSIYHLIKDRPGGQKSVEYMMDYARGRWPCRRHAILQYFGESITPPSLNDHNSSETINPHCCDLCDQRRYDLKRQEQLEKQHKQIKQRTHNTGNASTDDDWLENRPERNFSDTSEANPDSRSNKMLKMEISREIYMLLYTILECGGFYGLNVPVNILLGRHDKSTQQIFGFADKKFFGEGKHRSAEWWKSLARDLAMEHFIYNAKFRDNSKTVLKMRLLETTRQQRAGKYSYQAFQISEQGKRYLAGEALVDNNNNNKNNAKLFHPKSFHPVLHKLPTESIEFSSEFLHHHKLCNQKLISGVSHGYDANLAAQSRYASDLLPNYRNYDNISNNQQISTIINGNIIVKVEKGDDSDRDHIKRPRYDTAAVPEAETAEKRYMTFENLSPLSPSLVAGIHSHCNNSSSTADVAHMYPSPEKNILNSFSLSTQALERMRDGLLSDLQQRSLLPHRVISQEEIKCLSDFISTYHIEKNHSTSLEEQRQWLKDKLILEVLCWDELHLSASVFLNKNKDTEMLNENKDNHIAGEPRWKELCRVKCLYLDRVTHCLLPWNNALCPLPVEKQPDYSNFSWEEDILGKNTNMDSDQIYMSKAIAGGGSYGRSAEYLWKEQEKKRLSVFKSPATDNPTTMMKKSFSLYRPNYDIVSKEAQNIPILAVETGVTNKSSTENSNNSNNNNKNSTESNINEDEETICDIHSQAEEGDGEVDEEEEEAITDRDIFAMAEDYEQTGIDFDYHTVQYDNINDANSNNRTINNDDISNSGPIISQEPHLPIEVIDAYLSLAKHQDNNLFMAVDISSEKQDLSDDALFSPNRFQIHSNDNNCNNSDDETVDEPSKENFSPETSNHRKSSNRCYEFSAGMKAMRKKSCGIAGTLGKRLRTLP